MIAAVKINALNIMNRSFAIRSIRKFLEMKNREREVCSKTKQNKQ